MGSTYPWLMTFYLQYQDGDGTQLQNIDRDELSLEKCNWVSLIAKY